MKITALKGLASIQDLGRYSLAKLGINKNGAMDAASLALGNAILANKLNAPAIELALGSITLKALRGCTLCITGAPYDAYLGVNKVFNNWRLHMKEGESIELVRPYSGMYAYICVFGGFDIDPVLGSSSTNLSASFGGFKGRALKVGDIISPKSRLKLSSIGAAPIKDRDKIRVVKSSEYELFDEKSKNALVNASFKISSNSDRLGIRLSSQEKLRLKNKLELNSHGVSPGCIQVLPDGSLIALMRDSGVSGGYPKIASIIEADLGLFAQKGLNKQVSFELISLEDAIKARQERQTHIENVKNHASTH